MSMGKEMQMANLFDYLIWRGDLAFSKEPLNAVDSLIFCRMSYLPWEGLGASSRKRRTGFTSGGGESFFKMDMRRLAHY